MWRWSLTSLLAHWIIISAQPLTDKYEPKRTGECCPCPKDKAVFIPEERTFTPNLDNNELPERATNFYKHGGENSEPGDQVPLASSGTFAFAPGGAVDDCPCRFRDADSVGSSSILFPSTVRAAWPVMSSKENKEEHKPLLHPEVGLASSMLETLRQATDEEYEDALERDAARNAMRGTDDVESQIDSALDTAKKVVTFIINPEPNESQDEVVAEASHAHESRCIHPLGRSNIARDPLGKPSNLMSEIFRTPKIKPLHKNIQDMDNSIGASTLHQQVVDGNSKVINNLKSNPSLLNLFPDNGDKLNFQTPKVKLSTAFKDRTNSETDTNILEPFKNEVVKSHQILKQFLSPTKNDKNTISNIDRISVNDKEKTDSKFKFKTMIPISGLKITTMKPFNLKNMLKLKDVELISPTNTVNKEINVKDNVPKLIPSLQGIDLFKDLKTPNLGDFIRDGLKFNVNSWNKQSKNDNYKDGINSSNPLTNIQTIPNSTHKSEIIDTIPSPSENNVILINNDINTDKSCVNENLDSGNENNIKKYPKAMSTQILDSVPRKHTVIRNMMPNQNTIVVNKTLCPNFNEAIHNTDEIEILDVMPSASENEMIVASNKNNNMNSCEVHVIGQKESIVNDKLTDLADKQNNSAENSSESDDDYDEDEDNEENKDEDSDATRRGVQSNSEKILEQDCLDLPIKDRDLEPQTNNNVENINDVLNDQQNGNDDSSPNFISAESCDNKQVDMSKKYHFSKMVNDLSTLKETITKTLEDIKEPITRLNFQENSHIVEPLDQNVTSEECPIVESNEDANNLESATKLSIKSSKNTDDSSIHINSQELQNMSDNLLNLSSRKDQESSASETVQCKEVISGISENSNVLNESSDSSDEIVNESSENKDINMSTDTTHLDDAEGNGDITNFSNKKEEYEMNSKENDSNNICSNVNDNINEDRMTSEGSDPIPNTVTPENKPTTFWNIFKPGLGKPNLNIGDILNINLPTVDNLSGSSVMSNIYNEPNESVTESDVDESLLMDTQANTPFSKIVLPSLQPLEDIDLDIFQLNPLIEPQNILPKLPRFNVNSYKAKLPIPRIGIRPLKLESSIGNKNGLLGAKLTLGSKKSHREFEKGSSILGTSLNNFPTLEDLQETMRENAHNLLVTPLEITSRNVFDDTLRSGQTISDNIRSHTKNAMKDIQQTFETALKDVKNSDLALLGESLSNPHDFLQAVSRTHEDVNDKIKAIHYDLNDRFETIRDRIVDPSLLPSLTLPEIHDSLMYSKPGNIFKRGENKLMRYSDSASNKGSQRDNTNLKKSSSRNKVKLSSSQIKSPKRKPLKISSSEIPLLKASEIRASASEPALMHYPTFKTPQFLSNKKSVSSIFTEPISRFRDTKVPVLSKFKPKQNKVKISFSTTMRPKLLLERNKDTITTSKPKFSTTSKRLKNENLSTPRRSSIRNNSNSFRSKLRSNLDSNGAASDITVSRLKSPLNLSNGKKSDTANIDEPLWLKTSANRLKWNTDILNKLPRNKNVLSTLRINNLDRTGLPNTHAMQATGDELVEPSQWNSDMTRSASENKGIIRSKNYPLTENTSYTCKMMCIKND